MRHTITISVTAAVLIALTASAQAQQQIPVRDTTNLGTPFQGWYQCKDNTLRARLTIRTVERKQSFTVQIPDGRKVIGIDLVETAATPAATDTDDGASTDTPSRPRTGINRRLEGETGSGDESSADGGSDDGTPAPTFADPSNFRLVPILEGDAYSVEIVMEDGSAFDPEEEWLVGHEFKVKAAVFAKDDVDKANPVELEGASFRWGVEGRQLKSYEVKVNTYKGSALELIHGRRDTDSAYERYRNIISVHNTPLTFGIEHEVLNVEHMTDSSLSFWWQTEGAGTRRVTLRADVEIDGMKERYAKEIEVKLRRTDNPARHIFTYEGNKALPGGLDVLPNHSGWHYAYRGSDKFIFFHREFLKFYNEFRELFGYMRIMEELDPEGPAYGEDLANYTYLTEEGGDQSSPQHGAKKLADFETIADLGDDLEGPFHNRGHGTVGRHPGKRDMNSVRTAPNCDVFFMWHTKVDNVALDYEDLKDAELARAEEEAEEAERAKTLWPDPEAPEYGDLSGLYELKGKTPDGTAFTALAGVNITGKNVYAIHAKGQLETGPRFSFSASARRNSETEVEVLHSTEGRGLAGRILPDVQELPAITGKYNIYGPDENFGGEFQIGDAKGSVSYTQRTNPAVTFDPPVVTLRSGQRMVVTATANPVETMEMMWITDTGFLITGGVRKNRNAGAKRVTLEGQAPGEYELIALLNRGGAELAKTKVTVLPNVRDDLASRIAAAKQTGSEPIVVFDLDDTIFDSRARTLGLLKMWVEQNGASRENDKIAGAELDDMRNDVFRTLQALRYNGPDRAAIKAFVDARFEDGQHYHLDTPIEGALATVLAAKDAGATIVYLSDRPEDHRASTQQQLWGTGLPQGELILQSRSGSVGKWKAEQITQLTGRGAVVGVFDNEPLHANHMAGAAPAGTVFRMDTVAKPGAPDLEAGIETIGTFR